MVINNLPASLSTGDFSNWSFVNIECWLDKRSSVLSITQVGIFVAGSSSDSGLMLSEGRIGLWLSSPTSESSWGHARALHSKHASLSIEDSLLT